MCYNEHMPRLSKSRFTAGLQCHRLLWWRAHEPRAPELEVTDPTLRALFDRGAHVGELARCYVPYVGLDHVPVGTLIDGAYWDIDGRLAATRAALEKVNRDTVIYEAAFLEDGVFCAVDILQKVRGGWALVEVKSTTRVKPGHLMDVALQAHVLRRAGLELKRVELMHLDRECRHPALDQLFVRRDLTDEVEAVVPEIPALIEEQQRVLAGELPVVALGQQCTSPYDCAFLLRCWPERPDHHVGTLYKKGPLVDELRADGIETIAAIPDEVRLGPVRLRQREAVRNGRLVVEPSLAAALVPLRPPLAFLDFEAVQLPVPCWDGCRPYDAVPAQYSVHWLRRTGRVEHRHHLARGPDDPRPALAASLARALRGARHVLVYNRSFEHARIRELMAIAPELAGELAAIDAALVDLLPILRDNVYHPDFNGSFSIKAVLPALVPELSYDGLEVGDGMAASFALEQLLLHGKEELRAPLTEYCRLDTYALVRLYQRLVELSHASS